MEWSPPRPEHLKAWDPRVRDVLSWAAVTRVWVPEELFGPGDYIMFRLTDGGSYRLERVSKANSDRITREFDGRLGTEELSQGEM
jgi:hypothetical protein